MAGEKYAIEKENFLRNYNLDFDISKQYEVHKTLRGLDMFVGNPQSKAQAVYNDTLSSALYSYLEAKTKMEGEKEYRASDISINRFIEDFDRLIQAKFEDEALASGTTNTHKPLEGASLNDLTVRIWDNVKQFNKPLPRIWADNVLGGKFSYEKMKEITDAASQNLTGVTGENITEANRRDLANVVLAKKAIDAVNKGRGFFWKLWIGNWSRRREELNYAKELENKIAQLSSAGLPVNDVTEAALSRPILNDSIREINNIVRAANERQEPERTNAERERVFETEADFLNSERPSINENQINNEIEQSNVIEEPQEETIANDDKEATIAETVEVPKIENEPIEQQPIAVEEEQPAPEEVQTEQVQTADNTVVINPAENQPEEPKVEKPNPAEETQTEVQNLEQQKQLEEENARKLQEEARRKAEEEEARRKAEEEEKRRREEEEARRKAEEEEQRRREEEEARRRAEEEEARRKAEEEEKRRLEEEEARIKQEQEMAQKTLENAKVSREAEIAQAYKDERNLSHEIYNQQKSLEKKSIEYYKQLDEAKKKAEKKPLFSRHKEPQVVAGRVPTKEKAEELMELNRVKIGVIHDIDREMSSKLKPNSNAQDWVDVYKGVFYTVSTNDIKKAWTNFNEATTPEEKHDAMKMCVNDVFKGAYFCLDMIAEHMTKADRLVVAQRMADIALSKYSPAASSSLYKEYGDRYFMKRPDHVFLAKNFDNIEEIQNVVKEANRFLSIDTPQLSTELLEEITDFSKNASTEMYNKSFKRICEDKIDDDALTESMHTQVSEILKNANLKDDIFPEMNESLQSCALESCEAADETTYDNTKKELMERDAKFFFGAAYGWLKSKWAFKQTGDRIVAAQKIADIYLKNYSPMAINKELSGVYDNNYVLSNEDILKEELRDYEEGNYDSPEEYEEFIKEVYDLNDDGRGKINVEKDVLDNDGGKLSARVDSIKPTAKEKSFDY